MPNERIAIVGAGITGLTAARALRAAGFNPYVIDKGRRIGGRLATRITRSGHSFDHGAQFVTATNPRFKALLEGAMMSGMAAVWHRRGGRDRYVGHPEMVSLAAHIGRALKVNTGVEATGVEPGPNGTWRLSIGQDDIVVDRLVLTVPPAQAAALLGKHPAAKEVASIAMEPCLALMAAFPDGMDAPFDWRQTPHADLAFIAHDGGKPGRSGGATWVAHASPRWSRANLEAEKEEIAALMLPMLCAEIGRSPEDVLVARGHRWRYARAVAPLGKTFITDPTETLFVGGDWCLGQRVECAWESGTAIADAIIRGAL